MRCGRFFYLLMLLASLSGCVRIQFYDKKTILYKLNVNSTNLLRIKRLVGYKAKSFRPSSTRGNIDFSETLLFDVSNQEEAKDRTQLLVLKDWDLDSVFSIWGKLDAKDKTANGIEYFIYKESSYTTRIYVNSGTIEQVDIENSNGFKKRLFIKSKETQNMEYGDECKSNCMHIHAVDFVRPEIRKGFEGSYFAPLPQSLFNTAFRNTNLKVDDSKDAQDQADEAFKTAWSPEVLLRTWGKPSSEEKSSDGLSTKWIYNKGRAKSGMMIGLLILGIPLTSSEPWIRRFILKWASLIKS